MSRFKRQQGTPDILFIGIDPGATGAIAVINGEQQIHLLEDWPGDEVEVARIIRELINDALRVGVDLTAKNIAARFKAAIERVHSMPGQGIFLGKSPEYVTDYYFSGGEDPTDPKEHLITYEFDPSQITFGNLQDREWEISVPSAKVVDIKPLN